MAEFKTRAVSVAINNNVTILHRFATLHTRYERHTTGTQANDNSAHFAKAKRSFVQFSGFNNDSRLPNCKLKTQLAADRKQQATTSYPVKKTYSGVNAYNETKVHGCSCRRLCAVHVRECRRA